MKIIMICLVMMISIHICKINGCEIKEVLPNIIGIGDSITLTINFYNPDSGEISGVWIYSYNYRDTIHAVSVSQINDSTITTKFFIPETVHVGPASVVIQSDFDSGTLYCQSEEGIIIIGTSLVEKPAICMVTVDSANKNMIIWEKPDNNTIDSVFIYKETSKTNNYLKIGAKPADELNYFIDTESVPEQNSNSYKISFADTLGYESPLSDYHKTIHLTMNLGINGACNLIWDKYTGFAYSTYNIFKGSTMEGMLKIAELPANLFTYTDLAPNLGGTYYSVEVTSPKGCSTDDLKSTTADYASTRSNVIYLEPTSSIVQNKRNEKVSIYPNPVTQELQIENHTGKKLSLKIIDITGRTIIEQPLNDAKSVIKLNTSPGIYSVLITDEKGQRILEQKIVKQ